MELARATINLTGHDEAQFKKAAMARLGSTGAIEGKIV
jgi:hypothetical protein